jgi:hypothetical protein
MTARELEHIRERLTEQGRHLREALGLALLASVAAAAAADFSERFALALGAAALMGFGIAAATRFARSERIARLALNPDAYMIPEVAEYGGRCAGKRERERLADWIREVVAEGPRPESAQLQDRVARYADDLERVAGEMAAAARVRPPAAVACRRLLTHAVESPLYNPRLPAEQLRETLERIRRGIRSA